MPAKGQYLSLEARAKISKWNELHSPVRGTHLTDEARRKISAGLTGRHLFEETKAKISAARKGIKLSDETRVNMSKSSKGRHHSEEVKIKISSTLKKVSQNPEIKAKRKAAAEDLWRNTEYAQKVFKNVSPNKAELKLQDILDKHFPNEWKFVGNKGVRLGKLYPDFINVDGKKEVIELFSDYWHPIFDVAKKKESYREYGFCVAIIWEEELKNEERLVKIFRGRFKEV